MVVFVFFGTSLNDGVGDSWDRIIRTFHSSGRRNVGDLEKRYDFVSVRNRNVEALAACMYVLRETLPSVQLERVEAPVLIAVGDKDEFAGSAGGLANLIPRSDVLILPGFYHMGTITSALFQQGVVQFLRGLEKFAGKKRLAAATEPAAEQGAG